MIDSSATMQVPVLLEALKNRPGYQVRLGEPFNLSVEAESPEEALLQMSRAVQERLQAGAKILPLILPLKFPAPTRAGWLSEDDLTREWREAVEEYRRECDTADRRRILGDSEDAKFSS